MIFHQEELSFKTNGRGFLDITTAVNKVLLPLCVQKGLCTLFVQHTSASLIVNENADPTVRRDLEMFMSRLVQDGDEQFHHILEGKDDMSAHIRSVLTATSIQVPIQRSRLHLGCWQAIYLWEHRYHSHDRFISVSVIGCDN